MNIFEELLTDLKEENLLEDTILEKNSEIAEFDAANESPMNVQRHSAGAPALTEQDANDPGPKIAESKNVEDKGDGEAMGDRAPATTAGKAREFFKQRALAEMSGLQMVEHVLTGVEREYMKVKPRCFDDLKAKLALNKFLTLPTEVESQEHRSAELDLMKETQAWCTALAARDTKIFVSSLRQYCENTKPALSSHALLALCQFYRNQPYSESTRAKYDFLLTRLFSRPTADDSRVCLFDRNEALRHLENLYKDWSSVPLYAADDDDSKVMLTSLCFDDLAEESEHASSFDQLIESNFFSRLRMFKESIAELFFAPQITIAAVEANVRIGNVYVKLIAAERQKMDADTIQAKYGDIDHESVSDAAARTLKLVELLKVPTVEELAPDRQPTPTLIRENLAPHVTQASVASGNQAPSLIKRLTQGAFAVNKRLLTAAILLVSASMGIFFWANYYAEETIPATGVHAVGENSPLFREHLKTAKVSNEILFGLLNETWDILPKERRIQYVQRLLAQGPGLGYTQVNLTTKDGKPAAYGAKDKIDVEMP